MLSELQSFLQSQSTSDQFSGSVLLTQNHQPILEFSSGFSNRTAQVPNNLNTLFNLGSIDKIFTGVAIAQLAQRGELDFQDTIDTYISTFPKRIAKRVTIHHLLTHTEGMGSYFNRQYIANRLELHGVGDYLQLFKDESLLFEPGSKYQYSNSGYVVLGAIIEAIAGQSYYDYVKANIFTPANMTNTGSFAPDATNSQVAIGYTLRKLYSQERTDGPRRDNSLDLPPIGSPAGGGYSTCADLTNFASALLSHQLLNPDMTQEILTPKVTIGTKDGQTLHYGYGFQILDLGNGHFRYGHAGAFAGVNARLDMYPWLDLTAVVLSNYDEPSAFRIANKLTSICAQ